MKYLSLFSGVGGFELGIQRAFDNTEIARLANVPQAESVQDSTNDSGKHGRYIPTCIGYSEIDKYAIETYEHNWKGHTNYGDCTTIDETKLPDFDLLVGGFPCQAFSVAGKRLGFNETRGTLFFDIARILKHKRPRHLVLENVKGLLSHDSGKTFTTIIGVLTDLGYVVEWQVLNAKDFGVPQNRERVFIVGHLGGECGRQVFPIAGNDNQIIESGLVTVSAVTGVKDVEISPTLDTMYKKGLGSKQARPAAMINVVGSLNDETWQKRNESTRRVHGIDGIAPTTPTGTGGGVMTKIAVPVLTPDRLEKRQNGRRMKEDGEPSFTLNTQDKHGIYDGARIRRLTPLECERLMSWPDGWTIGSDTQRYKQCGNGVVSNVVEAVMTELNKSCSLLYSKHERKTQR